MNLLKKSFASIIALLAICLHANATIITISNDPDNSAQYATIQEGHDASVPGDTLYIFGSPILYDDFTLGKPLTIIGNGYNPVSQGTTTYPTEMVRMTLEATTTSGGAVLSSASGSHIIGLKVQFIFTTNATITDLIIERSRIENFVIYATINQWLIKNNIILAFDISSGGSMQNMVFANNIFFNFKNNNQSRNISIINNLFPAMAANFSSGFHTYFKNNIFLEVNWNDLQENFNQCSFKNNLCVNGAGNALPIGTRYNTGNGNLDETSSGNVWGVDPLFVNYSLLTGYGTDALDDEDYHLTTNSPAKNAGTDGTDLGIYGGPFPWPDDLGYTGMPSIPQIYEFELQNPLVTPQGALKIDTKIRKRN